MSAKLSIRSYTFIRHRHSHAHHQLVLPLIGSVEIDTGRHFGRASPGQCIIIRAGDEHEFAPEPGSQFLVVDLDELPTSMTALDEAFIYISQPVQAFCYFAQKQLEHRISPALELNIGDWLVQLLNEQDFRPRIDPRIARVMDHLAQDLSYSPPLSELADTACLSLSQFKTLFKKETAQTPGEYLLQLRMEKARALLVHTDYPINLIASTVGYQDISSFSHRFSKYFGMPPSSFRKK